MFYAKKSDVFNFRMPECFGAVRCEFRGRAEPRGNIPDDVGTFSFSHMCRSQTDNRPRAMSSLLEYCRGAKEEDEVSCLDYAMARTDERSMSRDELAQSMPCEEEEGEAKPRRSPRFLHFYRDMCPKVRIYSSFGICFLGKFVYLPTESPEKRCMMRRILSVGIGIV